MQSDNKINLLGLETRPVFLLSQLIEPYSQAFAIHIISTGNNYGVVTYLQSAVTGQWEGPVTNQHSQL